VSELQEVIATTSIKAFNEGVARERDLILKLLTETKQETKCECENCESWKNAFDWLASEIRGASDGKAL
jgi:hypothetical protein